jgi:hypothetical protein
LIEKQHIAAGYALRDNGDGTWTVGRDGAEVSNADELKAALENGGKVYLTSDVTIPENWSASVLEGNKATLDLLGNTVTIACKSSVFNSTGELTIKNGTVNVMTTQAGTLAGAIGISKNGIVNLENLTMNVTSPEGRDDVASVAIVIAGNGVLNLNEGAVINLNAAIEGYAVYVISGPATINMNGGKIIDKAPAEAGSYALIGQTDFTVNAVSGEISMGAGENHFAFFAYPGWGAVTVNLNERFVLNIEDGANAGNNGVTVVK